MLNQLDLSQFRDPSIETGMLFVKQAVEAFYYNNLEDFYEHIQSFDNEMSFLNLLEEKEPHNELYALDFAVMHFLYAEAELWAAKSDAIICLLAGVFPESLDNYIERIEEHINAVIDLLPVILKEEKILANAILKAETTKQDYIAEILEIEKNANSLE